jgi:hypothetical protein
MKPGLGLGLSKKRSPTGAGPGPGPGPGPGEVFAPAVQYGPAYPVGEEPENGSEPGPLGDVFSPSVQYGPTAIVVSGYELGGVEYDGEEEV